MDKNFRVQDVSERYLNLRKSNIIGFRTQTLALIFGLNTHIYQGSGNAIFELEKNPEVMKAMQSLLISSHQVLNNMKITTNTEYYDSEYVRAYLKTGGGIEENNYYDINSNDISIFINRMWNGEEWRK